jgi:hypothetical protein
MAKFQIRRACSCVETHALYGLKMAQIAKREYLESSICELCKRATKLHIAKIETEHLITLQGTDKQVNWATEIRYHAHRALTQLREIAVKMSDNDSNAQSAIQHIDSIINTKDDSKWWIDNREKLKNFPAVKQFIGSLIEMAA